MSSFLDNPYNIEGVGLEVIMQMLTANSVKGSITGRPTKQVIEDSVTGLAALKSKFPNAQFKEAGVELSSNNTTVFAITLVGNSAIGTTVSNGEWSIQMSLSYVNLSGGRSTTILNGSNSWIKRDETNFTH